LLRSISYLAATAVTMIAAFCQCSSVESGSTSRAGASALVRTTAQAIVTANNTITQAADEARTGWYPDQANLSPGVVSDPTKFGPIFSPVVLPLTPGEQVVAQPLVSADQKSVLVVTEQNNAYVLDAATGAIDAKRAFGTAFNAQTMVTPGCGDLVSIHAGQGGIGITGTPVIDVATNTAYFVTKSVDANQNVSVTFRGVDATTLVDRFATSLNGIEADNAAFLTFNASNEHQRPGLLFLNGIAYAAFGSHCDSPPFHGWVVGVNATGAIVAKFVTEVNPIASQYGAGIWGAGAGLVSDGPGRIFVMTGNGYSPAPTSPIAGTSPNAFLDNSMVRFQVQAGGALQPVQWFNPVGLAAGDQDLGSGGAVALPSQFGTAPNLMVGAGKAAKLYVVDRDNLGGFMNGPGGGDLVLSTTQVAGPVYSKPGVWPGDKLIYMTSNGGPLQALQFSNAGGTPTFTVTGVSKTQGGTDVWGNGTSSPIVTSNGTTTGTALVWVIDNGGTLHAFDAVPVGGTLTQVFSVSIGSDAKYSAPGVGQNALYIGTGDGRVFGFGVNPSQLSGPGVAFGSVVVGAHATQSATFTATAAAQVTALTTTDPAFTLGTPMPALGTPLSAGQTFTVPVTFAPASPVAYSAQLNATTSAGNGGTLGLSGTGAANGPALTATPTSLPFGAIVAGSTASQNTLLTNIGNQTLTFTGLTMPTPPFSVTSGPAVNSTLAPNASVALTVQFAPAADGTFASNVTLQSNSTGGALAIPLTGAAGAAPQLVIAPLSLAYGDVPEGAVRAMSFTVSNAGGTDLTITKSKPPVAGIFVATTSLPEGTVIAPGASLTETVSVTPTSSGSFSDVWTINGNDGGAARVVTFTATSGMASADASSASPDATGPAGTSGASGSSGIQAEEAGPAVQGAGTSRNTGCNASPSAPQRGTSWAAVFVGGWLALLFVRRKTVPGR
jgi:HYDIN/CFA65/VesB family protein